MDLWISIGSTYTYLTAMRAAALANAEGVRFRWRPFDTRHVMTLQGNLPFKDKPAKTAYMWRDIERRAGRYGLAPRLPAAYPVADLPRANRVALVGVDEGWVADYARAAYRLWFHDHLPVGEEPNLSRAVAEAGGDPAAALAAADGDAMGARLMAETEEAMRLGVFGTPTVFVDGEMFWGDDRLEDAIEWSRKGRLGD
ncbi:2-hydroxychromene-2-carboxylate isomerase [Jannaschia sp. W003]|uniref:2-hydroxychromene-2-carboxylate isomerase n=1 Tax=Jannaschia sp. W003 TaxID=2867012 RepID=UPI0021A44E55|nr:DsbA family protein [Jannaschia sp. W003]UWQ20690.1 DsbA family protein [Jannaschia sp. W003]